MPCPACGYGDNPPDANFCESCGATLQAEGTSSSAVVANSTNAGRVTTENGGLPVGARAVDPADAPTVELVLPQKAVELPPPAAAEDGLWRCVCGASNPATEAYCQNCGEARPVILAELAVGDNFAGFLVDARLDAQRLLVHREDLHGPQRAVLLFDEKATIEELVATTTALQPDALATELGHPIVPAVLAHGEDIRRGAYVALTEPEGSFTPLHKTTGLSPEAAMGCLDDMLCVVDHAARANRLLLLSALTAQIDGTHIFLPQPVAPSLPLTSALLADPAFLAPEVRSGENAPDAWRAGAFAAGALVRSVAGNGLGYPREWHALMRQLRAVEPERRPPDRAAAAGLLAGMKTRRFVSIHRTAFLTDIGHHHPINQDAGGVWTWQRWDGTPVTLAVVADGVSAGKHSEEASALTVELLHQAVEKRCQDREFTPDIADRVLREAGFVAHQRVSKMPYDSYDEANATTLVASCIIGNVATGIWCGDSRIYGVTPEGCQPLSRDHSWVNIMVDAGRMSLEQARSDPRAHVIARWLGVTDPPSADPGFDRFRRELAPGDSLLVCSDGLYMYYEPPADDELSMAEAIYGHGDDLEGAVGELVQTALDRGGFDNVTAVLVAIQ